MASIIPYIQMAGGQTVIVPDGTYTGGVLNSGGVHADWLVLVAATRGGVIVHDTGGGLILDPVTKVIFIGFTFTNTHVSVRNASADVAFWYPDMTFPVTAWIPGGYPANPLRLVSTGASKPQRTRVLGAEIHDFGDDAIQLNADDTTILGMKVYDGDNGGNTAFHVDAIQWTGGRRSVVNYCDLTGHVQVGEDAASITQVDVLNSWIHDGPNVGFSYEWFTGKDTVTGTRQRLYVWDHPFGDRLDYTNGTSHPAGSVPAFVNIVDTAVTAAAPPAGTPSPADVWRAANPYSSWPTYFGTNPVPPPVPGAGPSYVDGASNSGNSASATVVVPAGAVTGDLLHAVVHVPASLTVATPSGWTLATTAVSSVVDGNHSRQYVFYRIVTADAEAGTTITFTLSGADLWDVGLIVVRGISALHPVNAVASSAASFGTSASAPTVNTAADGCFIVAAFSGTTDNVASATWTQPTGLTERVDNGASNRSLAIDTAVQSTRGTAGPYAAVCSHNGYPIASTVAYAPADLDNWYITDAVNAGSSASATVTIPTGVFAGDLCHVVLQIPASLTATTPAGWTLIASEVSAVEDVDHSRQYVFYRLLTDDAEASDVVTFTLSGSGLWDVGMVVLRGVSLQFTVNDFDTQASGFGDAGTAPAVTTSADGCFIVVGLSGTTDNAAASTWTEPAGTTERVDNGASNRSLAIDAHLLLSRGTTGPFTATCLHNGYPIGSTVGYAPLAIDLPSGGGGGGGTPSGCTTFFPFFPLVLCASEIFSTTSVDNDGQGLAWPVWVIFGPGSDLVLTNLTTNETLSVSLALTSAQYVVIDTRPGVKTITDGEGNNLLGDSTGSLWSLARGVNALDIKLTGATDDSSVQLTYRRRWLSP